MNVDLPSIFIFASPEPGVSFECALDPAPLPVWSECASPPDNRAELSPEAGHHTLLVRAIDPAGNFDRTPLTSSWDVLGPALTTITANVPTNTIGNGTTTSTSATFSWTSDQTGVTYMCSFDGAEFAPCTSPTTVTHVTLGDHTFEVQSTNRFLHLEEPPAVFEWTVALPEGVERARDDDHHGSRGPEPVDDGDVHVLLRVQLGHLPVLARPRPGHAVRLGGDLHGSRAGRPHVPGGGRAADRHPGSVARAARVDGRRAAGHA